MDVLNGHVLGFWNALILTATGGQDARAPTLKTENIYLEVA